MKLWYVEHTVPPKHGERKTRVWRYYVLAESPEKAREDVLEHKALPEEGSDIEVTASDTTVVSVGLVFRDVERLPAPKSVAPKRNRQQKLGITQLAVLRALVNNNTWHAYCGWVWTTTRETVRYLNRLVELGLAEVKKEKLGDLSRDVYYPTETGKAAAA
jgi:hypothetical protein